MVNILSLFFHLFVSVNTFPLSFVSLYNRSLKFMLKFADMSRSFYNSHILDKVLDPEQHSSRRRDRSIRSADNGKHRAVSDMSDILSDCIHTTLRNSNLKLVHSERSKRRSPSTDSNQPRKRSKRLRLQSDDFEGVESPGTNEVPAEDVAYLDFGEELPEQSSRGKRHSRFRRFQASKFKQRNHLHERRLSRLERQQNEVLMVLQSIEKHLSTLASAASTERAVKPKPSTKVRDIHSRKVSFKTRGIFPQQRRIVNLMRHLRRTNPTMANRVSFQDVAAQVSPDGHRSNNASSSRRDNETVKREPEKNFYELITSKPSPLVTCPPPPKVNAETICLVCFGAGHWAGCCPTKERIARGKLCGLYKHLCCHCHTPRSLHKM